MSSTVLIDPVDENTNNIPKIVVDSASTADDLSITPASSSFPTNDDVPVHGGEAPVERELDRIVPASSSIPTENNPLPSPHSLQLIDELKYLLKSTNSLASPAESVQTSVRLVSRSLLLLFVTHNSKKLMPLVNVDRLRVMSISPTIPNVG